jgi:hypothetical protein
MSNESKKSNRPQPKAEALGWPWGDEKTVLMVVDWDSAQRRFCCAAALFLRVLLHLYEGRAVAVPALKTKLIWRHPLRPPLTPPS